MFWHQPGFEGGDISCGMRATDGAIEACTIDEETMEPSLSIIDRRRHQSGGRPRGSGIIDVIAELFRCKMLSPKGKFIREESGYAMTNTAWEAMCWTSRKKHRS